MPRFSAFSALRYTSRAGPLEAVLAPPYDVIDSAHAADLRSRSPFNAVRVVLPEGEGPARYGAAAADLIAWQAAGVLARDTEPGVYVYRQEYEYAGSPLARLAVFGALDLVPLDTGDVLPHERTHAGPKQDRLALTLATRTQLSPVFMAGRDPDGLLLDALRAEVKAREPDVSGRTPDGIRHALWHVVGSAASDLCDVVSRGPLLIADGHHRYETALEAARQLDTGEARRVLVCVVSELDPGLVIQPTHRTLTTWPPGVDTGLLERLGAWFDIQLMGPCSATDAAARVADQASSLILVRGNQAHMLTPRLETERHGTGPGDGIAAVQFDKRILGA
ncbi:MAG: DUF1015 domain-containing protein, partial [Gemmatimonadota bacterium]|nr:DUF1015 domain-containing protein [Gemmatimonadota bacterium]